MIVDAAPQKPIPSRASPVKVRAELRDAILKTHPIEGALLDHFAKKGLFVITDGA